MNRWLVLAVVLVGLLAAVYYWLAYLPSRNLPAAETASPGAALNNPPAVEPEKDSGAENPPQSAEAASAAMAGIWQSTEDSQYVMVLQADGTVEERYGNEITDTGTWRTLDSLEGTAVEIRPDFVSKVYLQKTLNGEVYFYNVVEAEADSLVLIYLDRGNILSFTPVR